MPSPAAGYSLSRTVPRPPWNPSTVTSRASPVANASVGAGRATTATRVPFAVVTVVVVGTGTVSPSTFTTSPSVTRTNVRCTAVSALSSRSTTPCSAETRSRVPVTEKPSRSTVAVYSLFPRYARATGNARRSSAERNGPSRAYPVTRDAYAASVSFTRTATPNSANRSLALPPILRAPTTTRTARAASTTSPVSSASSSARSSARSCAATVSVAALVSTKASARSTTAST